MRSKEDPRVNRKRLAEQHACGALREDGIRVEKLALNFKKPVFLFGFVLGLFLHVPPYLATPVPQAFSDSFSGMELCACKVLSKSDLTGKKTVCFFVLTLFVAELTSRGAIFSTPRVMIFKYG